MNPSSKGHGKIGYHGIMLQNGETACGSLLLKNNVWNLVSFEK